MAWYFYILTQQVFLGKEQERFLLAAAEASGRRHLYPIPFLLFLLSETDATLWLWKRYLSRQC